MMFQPKINKILISSYVATDNVQQIKDIVDKLTESR